MTMTPAVHADALVARARTFALIAHGDQLYGSRPYIEHLEAVAQLLREAGACSRMVAAGYLHDVLEDTSVTQEQLVTEFGDLIAGLVYAVTGEGRSRAQRSQCILRKLEGLPSAALLKLADRLANVQECVETGNQRLLAMYRSESAGYRELFLATGSPLALRLEALLLEPAAGLCVCIAAERSDRMLSVQRRRRPELLGLPGGKLDAGELPAHGALREFFEETGYRLTLRDLHLAYCAQDETGVTTATFFVTSRADWPDEAIGPEGTQVRFVPAAELADPQRSEFAQYNTLMQAALTACRREFRLA